MSVITHKFHGVQTANGNYKFENNYTVVYKVFCNDPEDGPVVCLSYLAGTVGIQRGSQYIVNINERNVFAFCTDYDAEREARTGNSADSTKTDIIWVIKYHFGPFPWSEREQNPLDRPYIVTFDIQDAEEPVLSDINGKKILNTAGDPYVEPIIRPRTYTIVRVQRNEAAIDPSVIQDFLFSVNESSWTIVNPPDLASITFDARQALCTKIDPQYTESQIYEQLTGFPAYWSVTYEFLIKVDTWNVSSDDQGQGHDRRILNIGYNELKSSKRQRIQDATGNPVPNPVPLDVAGASIDPVSGTPTYRTYRIYKENDFTTFNFTWS